MTRTAETPDRLLDRLARLRRLGDRLPGDPDVRVLLTEAEDELGPTVTRAAAARFLGVTPAALERWHRSGDLPVVHAPSARIEVPVASLLSLADAVARHQAAGRRHALEPAFAEARQRAERLDPVALAGAAGSSDERVPGPQDRHAVQQLRSLVYHRALAERLDPAMVLQAGALLRRRRRDRTIDERWADRWEQVLGLPLSEIREVLSSGSDDARDLRQTSPFAGLLSEPERRKIIEAIT